MVGIINELELICTYPLQGGCLIILIEHELTYPTNFDPTFYTRLASKLKAHCFFEVTYFLDKVVFLNQEAFSCAYGPMVTLKGDRSTWQSELGFISSFF